jgi:hypothetical protein
VLLLAQCVHGQSLAPRAYLITPVDSNAVTISSSFYTGGVLFDNAVPITNASGKIGVILPSFYHSLNFLGRSSNVTLVLPYSIASFRALVVNQNINVYRSGIGDGAVRFSVNLTGGPAMSVPQFMEWKQKKLLGASFAVQFPSGQYDSTRLINIGDNRWGFKPEIGYSQRWSKWILDGYAGGWFFTKNAEFFSQNSFFPGIRQQSQEAIGVVETHLSRDFKPGVWFSLDGNFWYGGRTTLGGVQNLNSLQRNSRVGATAAFRISKHQSLKFSYARGAYIRVGGDYQAVTIAWQYSWIGRFFK